MIPAQRIANRGGEEGWPLDREGNVGYRLSQHQYPLERVCVIQMNYPHRGLIGVHPLNIRLGHLGHINRLFGVKSMPGDLTCAGQPSGSEGRRSVEPATFAPGNNLDS